MGRGRRSEAGLRIVAAVPAQHRPTPPPDMNEAERATWRAIVAAMPARWFTGAESLLSRHVALVAVCEQMESRIRTMMSQTGPIDAGLLAAHVRVTTALIKTAASLRLSPRSQYTARHAGQRLRDAKSPAARSKPWDISGGPGDDDSAA